MITVDTKPANGIRFGNRAKSYLPNEICREPWALCAKRNPTKNNCTYDIGAESFVKSRI